MEEEAKDYLLTIPFWTKKKNSLDQVRDFLKELGDPEQNLSLIHVAGTNGKGSVCADLTAILKTAGYRVGTFVSPHLMDIRERFLLDGKMIGCQAFEDCFQKVLDVTKKMTAKGYCHPSFFEFVFLMAMVWFDREQVNYAILETGLGGRQDATNAIRHPLACIITSISFDHTQYLGSTISEIAGEKAGIIKAGAPVIYDDNLPAASKVIRKQAAYMGVPAYGVKEEYLLSKDRKEKAVWIDAAGFAAPYQAMNAALAVKALEVLKVDKVDENIVKDALSQVQWPGRMEEIGPGVWLDGAHNPGGIQAFIRAVKEYQGPLHLLFAAVSDKDYPQMIRMLCQSLTFSHVTVVRLGDQRGVAAEQLAQEFCRWGCSQVQAYENIGEALPAALSYRRKGDRLYVVGSLYLIGEIKKAEQTAKVSYFRDY